MKKLYGFLFILLFINIFSQTVFWRSGTSRANWWDSENPWYRTDDGWWLQRPDIWSGSSDPNNLHTDATYLNFDNNSQLNMNVNGNVWFAMNSITFKNGANQGRTFTSSGTNGISVVNGMAIED